MKIPKILLALICVLFLFTRFYKITEIPASVYWDEASIGYNAYSIAQTGKDEWGDFLPLHFRAFGEFKLPTYIYAAALSVKLLGLNEFSVRFPAALFSLGVVILTYYLARKFSKSESAGLIAAFSISVSPWFFIFSRTGYEVTAGLMFYLLAILLFLHIQKNNWLILFSTLSFILSIYSYNSFRAITPLTLFILMIFHRKILKVSLPIIISISLVFLSIIPLFRLYKYDAGISRLQAVGSPVTAFANNYLSHFSPNFLLFQGDKNLRSQQAGFGQLYLPELALFMIGLLYIISRKQKSEYLLIVLLLLGPIPAAITKESPHALRALSMAPFIAVISALGVRQLHIWTKRARIFYAAVVIVFFAYFVNYFLNFLSIYSAESAKDWQFGYKKIFTDYKDVFSNYDKIIVSDEYGQPYIFALFYQKFNPDQFRQSVTRNSVDQWGFSAVSSFDKFEFGKADKILSIEPKHSLIFATEEKQALNLTSLGSIKFLDGEKAFWVYEK